MQTSQYIENILRNTFQPEVLQISDDSAQHIGHREASAAGGSHFSILMVSNHFSGLSAIKRHRAVYEVLAPLMNHPIHALALKLYTSAEYQNINSL